MGVPKYVLIIYKEKAVVNMFCYDQLLFWLSSGGLQLHLIISSGRWGYEKWRCLTLLPLPLFFCAFSERTRNGMHPLFVQD